MLRFVEETCTELIVSKQQNLFSRLGNSTIDTFIDIITPHTFVDFDTETTGLDYFVDKILLMSFHVCKYEIKYDDVGPFYTLSDRYKLVIDCQTTPREDVIRFLNVLKTKVIVAHNAKFDIHMTLGSYGIRLDRAYCTMVIEQTRTSGLRDHFKAVAKAKKEAYEAEHAADIITKKLLKKEKEAEARRVNKARKGFDLSLSKIVTDQEIEDRIKVYSLGATLERVLGIKLDKTLQKSFVGHKGEFTINQIEYAADDVVHLTKLRLEQLRHFNEFRYLCKLELDFLQVVVDMERVGLELDVDKFRAVLERNKKTHKELEKKLNEEFIRLVNSNKNATAIYKKKLVQLSMFDEVNLDDEYTFLNTNSPVQMKSFFNVMGYDVIVGTGEDDLEDFRKTHPNDTILPFVDILLDIRKCSKIIGSYGEEYLEKHVNPVTKRVHTSILQMGTDTGRIASTYPNLQNVPLEHNNRHAAGLRECFSAGKGLVLISSDLAGQEVRIAGAQSKDKFIITNVDGDYHSMLAMATYRVIKDDPNLFISKKVNKELREKHKSNLFTIIYGGGVGKIAANIECSMNMAIRSFKAIKAILVGLMAYQDRIKKEAIKYKKVTFNSITSRFRKWPNDHPTYKIESEACNAPIQGTAADMMKEILVVLWRALNALKAKDYEYYKDVNIIMPIHDQILTGCPIDVNRTGEIVQLQESIMVEIGTKYLYNLIPMAVETDLSIEWHH